MNPRRSNLGGWGEDLAESYLEELGWRLEHRNYETPVGECDLVAWDDGTLVFAEVKTRTSDRFGAPVSSVNRKKRDQLRKVARYYLSSRDDWVPCRFDVIGIHLDGTETHLNHIRGAFGRKE